MAANNEGGGRSSDYGLVVSRGYVQLVRRGARRVIFGGWRGQSIDLRDLPEADWDDPDSAEPDWDDFDLSEPDWAEDEPPLTAWVDSMDDEGGLRCGRGDSGQTRRSRNNMRRLFASLPWELLGRWPAVMTLTYPGDWQQWVPNGRVWEQHRRAFERRWFRKWGQPLIGVWAKEFQNSGRPHLHLYIGLPDVMAAADFDGLRARTLLRKRLERRHGLYEGRSRLPAIGLEYGGEFAMWARNAWSEIVKTQGADRKHHARGVDVAVMFFTDEAEAKADRTRVAAYLAREASKFQQKKPPEGFVGVGQYYGRWGKAVGFNPVTEEVPLDSLVGWEFERRLVRWVNWKLHVLRRGAPPRPGGFALRRRGDGVTAFGLGSAEAMRVLRWAEASAARKRLRFGVAGGPGA